MDKRTETIFGDVARMLAKSYTDSEEMIAVDSFHFLLNEDQREMLESIYAFDHDDVALDFIEQFDSLLKHGYMKKAKPFIRGIMNGSAFNATISEKHQFHFDTNEIESNFVEITDKNITSLKIKGRRIEFTRQSLDNKSLKTDFYEKHTYKFPIVSNKVFEKTYSDSYEPNIEYTVYSKDLQK